MSSNFDTNLKRALHQNRASSKNLSAFALDVEYYLEQTGLFSDIRCKKPGEIDHALLVTCRLTSASTPASDVIKTLEELWAKAPLTYGGTADEYRFRQPNGAIEMDFYTVSSSDIIVTGRIIITRLKKLA